jgi:hypothetical protein
MHTNLIRRLTVRQGNIQTSSRPQHPPPQDRVRGWRVRDIRDIVLVRIRTVEEDGRVFGCFVCHLHNACRAAGDVADADVEARWVSKTVGAWSYLASTVLDIFLKGYGCGSDVMVEDRDVCISIGKYMRRKKCVLSKMLGS